MTNATEPQSSRPRARPKRGLRHLDTIAAVLIAAVGLALTLPARGFFDHQERGACPGGYCGLSETIGSVILITAILALLLAAGVAAHRRLAQSIGLVVCSLAGGGLLFEVLRVLADSRGIDPDFFAFTLASAGVAVALTTAAVLLFFSRDWSYREPR